MRTAVLVLDDAGLSLLWPDGDTLTGVRDEPGCALWTGDDVVVGSEADRRSRELPRNVHDRYWSELDDGALPPPFPEGWRSLELAGRQLETLARSLPAGTTSLLVAVPGSFSGEALGRVAGLVRATGLPLSGFVDAAVAATACTSPLQGRVLHVALGRHETVLTEMEGDEDGLGRRRVEALPELGTSTIQRRLVTTLSSEFVQHARFDPLRSAMTEQRLHDLVPRLLGPASERPAELRLDTADGPRVLEVDEALIARALSPLTSRLSAALRRRLDEGSATRVLLSSRVGWMAELTGLPGDVETTVLPDDAVATGALAASDQLTAGELARRLRWSVEPVA
ncbi:MAG: hypothetical protein AAF533_15825 [Acidobacteriota bacterium]